MSNVILFNKLVNFFLEAGDTGMETSWALPEENIRSVCKVRGSVYIHEDQI